MSQLIVEVKPFDTTGTYETTWTDVTDDVIVVGDFTVKLDNDEYNAGVFKNSSSTITFANESGKYSEVGEVNSIFNYTRNNSQVRVSWNHETIAPICGLAICGESILAAENSIIFVGLLSDESVQSDIKDQKAKFKLMGRESKFDQVETPFSSISNGDSFEDILYTILNQTPITDILTVNSGNISVGTNQLIDDKSDWENTTVKEILSEILEISGSILYIADDTIYIKERTQSSLTSSITLYGQASDNGPENIQALTNIKSGLNKTVNYWTWEDTVELATDATSALKDGVRKKEIGYTSITDTTKINAILDYNLAEFKNLKEELQVTVLATQETVEIEILTGVTIDYPTVYQAADENPIPLYGVSYYGEAVYPIGEYSKTISTDTIYKLMGKKYNFKNDLVTYFLREK